VIVITNIGWSVISDSTPLRPKKAKPCLPPIAYLRGVNVSRGEAARVILSVEALIFIQNRSGVCVP
jgi:hypothetical protein